jgi:HK97 family phage prohead protease
MKEYRISNIKAEKRDNLTPAGVDQSFLINGVPIVFDTPTVINDPKGSYNEIITRGALNDCDISDVRLLYNHDLDKIPLARTPKTMDLKIDQAGLSMSASLPDTEEARSVYQAVKRGDLSGMSFAFTVPAGGDKYDLKTNTRTISKISKLYECSVVAFPAYPTTSVEARAQMQKSEAEKNKETIKIMINKILFKGEL